MSLFEVAVWVTVGVQLGISVCEGEKLFKGADLALKITDRQ
jgi:hypothetical protein